MRLPQSAPPFHGALETLFYMVCFADAVRTGIHWTRQADRLPKEFLRPTIYQPKCQQAADSDEIVIYMKYKYVVSALRSTKVLFLFIWESLFGARRYFSASFVWDAYYTPISARSVHDTAHTQSLEPSIFC